MLVACATFVGVLHAAGVLNDKMLRSMATNDVHAVFVPKALAASHVQAIMMRTALEGFGLFSSIASVFGSVGQANYAAANAYLDALVRCRRSYGALGSSLQIPAVGGSGMGATTFDKEQLDAMGAASLDEFASWLAHGLMPVLAGAERVQALLSPKLLDMMHAAALFEAQRGVASTPT